MQILHVITGTNTGGAEIMLYRYLRALDRQADDHQVISLLPLGEVADRIKTIGISVTSLNMGGLLDTPRAALALRRAVRAHHPDVVHGWMYHGNFLSRLALLGMNAKRPGLLWAVHHSLSDIAHEKRGTRIMLRMSVPLSRQVGCISYCSAVSRDQHHKLGFRDDRAVLIPNAVDTDEFRPNDLAGDRLRQLCGIPAGRVILGNVARAHPMKDHVTMVHALAQLRDQGRDVHGVLIGAGHSDATSPARRSAQSLGISDRLSTLEARCDIPSLVAGFDLFVLSSAWGEAFPLAVAEAMAAGIPCVVTDCGDTKILVGKTGRVVAPNRPDLLAQEIADLLDLSMSQRQGLGQAARERVKQEFSLQRYVAAHQSIYQDLAAGLHPSYSGNYAHVH